MIRQPKGIDSLQRSLWLLVAAALLSGGCSRISQPCTSSLTYCRPGLNFQAGYHETNWSSLDPSLTYGLQMQGAYDAPAATDRHSAPASSGVEPLALPPEAPAVSGSILRMRDNRSNRNSIAAVQSAAHREYAVVEPNLQSASTKRIVDREYFEAESSTYDYFQQ